MLECRDCRYNDLGHCEILDIEVKSSFGCLSADAKQDGLEHMVPRTLRVSFDRQESNDNRTIRLEIDDAIYYLQGRLTVSDRELEEMFDE